MEKMKEVHVDVACRPADVAGFLAEARRLVPQHGWLLFESVAQADIMPFDQSVDKAFLERCHHVRVFGGGVEMRLEREPGGKRQCRIVLETEQGGTSCLCRETEYIIRGGRLMIHREYFKQDSSGMLSLCCECAAGVREG